MCIEIKRDIYLKRLIRKRKNGLVKIVTDARRSGKSYLLFKLFHDYLLRSGVPKDHIIELAFDDRSNKALRDPDVALNFLKNKIRDESDYYVILDEIQYLEEFEDVLNSLLHIRNVDVYVTGNNSKFLSTDVITEFRGRGDEIRVYPLCFREYVSESSGSLDAAWDDYLVYGGLPLILSLEDPEDKANYLATLFRKVYISDIVERHNVKNRAELDELVDVLASAVGSYTNNTKIVKTSKSVKNKVISDKTIKKYIDYLVDAFVISSVKRFDVKGRKYIGVLSKYYFEDVGLRNARLGVRQTEPTCLMENVVYNELRVRGYNVDVGVIDVSESDKNGKRETKRLEVDFVATLGSEKVYVQSAYSTPTFEKMNQEQRGLVKIPDSFRKIIVVGENIKARRDEDGVITIGLRNFLFDENSLRL